MYAIDVLTSEHRLIDATLDALLVWSEQAQRGAAGGGPEDLRRFVAFLREFVDEYHHGKEEQILFAAMKTHGVVGPHGPVAVMLHEHEQGRALIAALDGFARQTAPWGDTERAEVADLAVTYAVLMRQHVRKEDTILYPMAMARLPADGRLDVSARMERFDRMEVGRGTQEQLRRLADALVAAYRPRAA